MDMQSDDAARTKWVLNLTEEEADNLAYLSKTTGYTVQGIMMNPLLSVLNNPLSFMRECDISVLEPYKFDDSVCTDAGFDKDGHFSLFGSRLSGCRAAVDKILGTVITVLNERPMTTTSILWSIPEAEALCTHKGGNWSESTVGNEVRDMLKAVAQHTDWIGMRVNGRHEFVFFGTPKLKEYMLSHPVFERSNLERFAVKNMSKSYEDLVAPRTEPEAALEAEEEEDTDEELVQTLSDYAMRMNRHMQAVSARYPLEHKDATVYAKTLPEIAIRYMVENEGAKTMMDLLTYLKDATTGEYLVDSERTFDRHEEGEIQAATVSQLIHCLHAIGILNYESSDDMGEELRVHIPTKVEEEMITAAYDAREKEIERKHRLLNDYHGKDYRRKFGLILDMVFA